jgi:hypothetical protein
MAISEARYLKTMWERNECPNCRCAIPEGAGVGNGRKADGAFCSLDCYAKYYALRLAEKAKLVARGRTLL